MKGKLDRVIRAHLKQILTTTRAYELIQGVLVRECVKL